ncbi:Sporulation and spore germination [Caloramator fervidus]|uniref:Sporulation and spore germination n=1 Tax=Caloramator fervidus TaxID=29344 RepID=A0A1H5XFU6_9CLOT|nr:GerMN domain-containing protein [Caloramator fervidus]SEG10335.1 Sporulation and spore germination [Caloramator fervidus]
MKRILTTLLCFFIILGCKSLETKIENIDVDQKKQLVNIILYYPDASNKLKAEERKTFLNASLERTIIEELIKGPKTLGYKNPFPKGTKLISVSKKDDLIIVNLSKEFIKNHPGGKVNEELTVFSLVNSLTEIPGIRKVLIRVNGKTYDTLKGNVSINVPLMRNRSYFDRDKKALPNEILKRQMTLEKEGRWLEAYLLMSDDENNTYRKYYDDYVKEMEETKALGFLNADFVVGGYILDPTKQKAKVKVNFYQVDSSGKKVLGKDLYFTCVNIDGAWLVDWLTAQ